MAIVMMIGVGIFLWPVDWYNFICKINITKWLIDRCYPMINQCKINITKWSIDRCHQMITLVQNQYHQMITLMDATKWSDWCKINITKWSINGYHPMINWCKINITKESHWCKINIMEWSDIVDGWDVGEYFSPGMPRWLQWVEETFTTSQSLTDCTAQWYCRYITVIWSTISSEVYISWWNTIPCYLP